MRQGKYITFGALEQYDVQKWAYYIARRNKSRLPIYLYGESMGAAAALMASGRKLPKEVKGLIADCGFRSMKQQIKDMAANWFHLHWTFAAPAGFVLRHIRRLPYEGGRYDERHEKK